MKFGLLLISWQPRSFPDAVDLRLAESRY